MATHVRIVRFNDNFLIRDVLYVLDFAYDLISIFKSVFAFNYEIIFASNFCVIENKKERNWFS